MMTGLPSKLPLPIKPHRKTSFTKMDEILFPRFILKVEIEKCMPQT